MADDRTFKDNADQQGLQGDAIIDLWTLDLQPIDPAVDPNNRFIRFCNWVVADGQSVFSGGLEYIAIPFQAGGFNLKTEGVPPSPSITLGNVGLEWTSLANTWNDLIGGKMTRRRILRRYLDDGTAPDPNGHWPDEDWTIQQKEQESKLAVTFRLSTAFDLDGVMLPRRRALRYTCPWVYRGDGCGYSGAPLADVNDQPLTTSTYQPLQAVFAARETMGLRLSELKVAESNYNAAIALTNQSLNELQGAQNARNNYNGEDTMAEERYSFTKWELDSNTYAWIDYTGGHHAYWAGVDKGGGYEWRKGPYVDRVVETGKYEVAPAQLQGNHYKMQRWVKTYNQTAALDAALATAQTNYDNARGASDAAYADYVTAQTNYNNAKTDYDNAVAAYEAAPLPPGDDNDVCGKRLTSCRLRFYDPVTETYADLPYGGFPGLTL
jgi:lambda family phage minor tail protein L